MIICSCLELDDKDLERIKREFGESYIAVLAKQAMDVNGCCACVRDLKINRNKLDSPGK